jgi:hypothetical protein
MALAGAVKISATISPPVVGATIECIDQAKWDSLAARFCDHNVRQLWSYGTILALRQGAASAHVAIRTGSRVIGIADVRVRTIPVVGGGIAYVSGGPLTRTGSAHDLDDLHRAMCSLIDEYVRRRGLVLRVALPLGPVEWNARASELMAELGGVVQPSIRQYRTSVVDLTSSLPQIRARLAQKWRNCLNAAERNGLTVVEGDGDALFARFEQLSREFRQRKQFAVQLDLAFYRDVRRHAGAAVSGGALEVSLAELNGVPVAGMLCSTLGDTAVYLLGATATDGLRTKAAYLLQWNAIVRAKSRDICNYDLGGIDPNENPGVSHFKAGLRGGERAGVAPFDFHSRAIRGRIVLLAERAYRFTRSRSGT